VTSSVTSETKSRRSATLSLTVARSNRSVSTAVSSARVSRISAESGKILESCIHCCGYLFKKLKIIATFTGQSDRTRQLTHNLPASQQARFAVLPL
jgi:hypothetical protein